MPRKKPPALREFNPTAKMLLLRDIITEGGILLSKRDIAKKIGASEQTVGKWWRNRDFVQWLGRESQKAFGATVIPKAHFVITGWLDDLLKRKANDPDAEFLPEEVDRCMKLLVHMGAAEAAEEIHKHLHVSLVENKTIMVGTDGEPAQPQAGIADIPFGRMLPGARLKDGDEDN